MKKILILVPLFFVFSLAEGKLVYRIHALNGINTGNSGNINYYTISSWENLRLIAVKHGSMFSWYGITVDWYVDSIYQFTQGDTVEFSQPGLISFITASYSSDNKVQLTVVTDINDLSSSTLPFPFSQLSPNINTNNLNYTIINTTGQVMGEGKFTGEIILRTAKPQRPLPPGIYFVIYSDALDNRQVLTDKVFVGNQ